MVCRLARDSVVKGYYSPLEAYDCRFPFGVVANIQLILGWFLGLVKDIQVPGGMQLKLYFGF